MLFCFTTVLKVPYPVNGVVLLLFEALRVISVVFLDGYFVASASNVNAVIVSIFDLSDMFCLPCILYCFLLFCDMC